ncbi:MAG: TolB family protein [Acidobacteriota bacterium]
MGGAPEGGRGWPSRLVGCIAIAVAVTVSIALPALAGSAKTRLVSENSAGDAATGNSTNPSISASGRFVVFESRADNLGGSGANADVYVRNPKTGKTRVVSTTSAGDAVGNSGVSNLGGAISGDGRCVVFHSNSSSLPGDHTGGINNVYLHDRKTGKTRLVSKTSAGEPASGGSSQFATVSTSGRYVAFSSQATNLPGDHSYPNVYLRDRKTGKTRLASVTSGGDPATGGQSVGALVSPSGRYVGFESNATNLGGDNSYTDVFVHDRKTGKTRLISQNSAGDPATGNDSYGGWVSGSGRFVGFESGATNLPGDHTGLHFNVYVRDLKTRKTKLVSKNSAGEPATDESFRAFLSESGRYVAFVSESTNLPGDHTYRNVYLRDRKTGRTTLVSRTTDGDLVSGGNSDSPAISASGGFVAFASKGTNLPGDHLFTNLYVRGPLP